MSSIVILFFYPLIALFNTILSSNRVCRVAGDRPVEYGIDDDTSLWHFSKAVCQCSILICSTNLDDPGPQRSINGRAVYIASRGVVADQNFISAGVGLCAPHLCRLLPDNLRKWLTAPGDPVALTEGYSPLMKFFLSSPH
jgi:hypothetical protein